jgi:cAMP phosphodiesterase
MNNASDHEVETAPLRTSVTPQPTVTNKRTRAGRYSRKPALQVICLGASGGPSEENVTAFLVRSLATEWAKGSLLAVDAGSHLAPITRIVEKDFALTKQRADADERREAAKGTETPGLSNELASTSLSPTQDTEADTESSEAEETPKPEPMYMTYGPFAGMKLPHASGRANALHLLQTYISTYLITHPHLDHISGFAINTAAFHATSRPKTLAALPGTVDAIKKHIFNDVIWPNLSDEDGGVGFVTFQRLKEGGDAMLGEGHGRGYIDVCDGLGAKAFKVSHGVCTKSPPAHQHRGSVPNIADSNHGGSTDMSAQSLARSMSFNQHTQFSAPGTPGPTPRQSFHNQQSPRIHPQENSCVVDSTAYFIRDSETGREVLIFGDVEPDSLSLTPRNYMIWAEAAKKVASGCLTGILIECSYSDSCGDDYLFGHLAPRHLVAELVTLAGMVREAKLHLDVDERQGKKRKRSGMTSAEVARLAVGESERKRSRSLASRTVSQNHRRRSEPDHSLPVSSPMHTSTGPPSPEPGPTSDAGPVDAPMSPMSHSQSQPHQPPNSYTHPHYGPNGFARTSTFEAGRSTTSEPGVASWDPPLKGMRVVVIHVKDTYKDGPHVSETINEELNAYEQGLKEEGKALGCEFVISKSGESYWF